MARSPSAVPPPCVPIAVRTRTSLHRGFRNSTAARTTVWMSRMPRLGIVSPTTLSSRSAVSGKILCISRNTAARTSGSRGLANTCSTTATGGRFVTRGHRSVFIVVAPCTGKPAAVDAFVGAAQAHPTRRWGPPRARRTPLPRGRASRLSESIGSPRAAGQSAGATRAGGCRRSRGARQRERAARPAGASVAQPGMTHGFHGVTLGV